MASMVAASRTVALARTASPIAGAYRRRCYAHPEWPRLVAATRLWRGTIRGDPREQQDDVIEFVVRPLAEEFQVSPQAMRIRLERLGWVVRDLETTESLFGAA